MTRATTVHAMPGRLRLRLREHIGDEGYFDELARSLQALPRVRSIRVDARTGSVLIEHEGSLEALTAEISAAELLDIAAQSPHDDVLHVVRGRIDVLEDHVRTRSRGAVGLDALSFYALLGGAAIQLFRGPVLPASATLFIQAAKIIADVTPIKRRTSG